MADLNEFQSDPRIRAVADAISMISFIDTVRLHAASDSAKAVLAKDDSAHAVAQELSGMVIQARAVAARQLEAAREAARDVPNAPEGFEAQLDQLLAEIKASLNERKEGAEESSADDSPADAD